MKSLRRENRASHKDMVRRVYKPGTRIEFLDDCVSDCGVIRNGSQAVVDRVDNEYSFLFVRVDGWVLENETGTASIDTYEADIRVVNVEEESDE